MWNIPNDDQKAVILDKAPYTIASLLFKAFERNVPDMKVDQHVCMPMKITRQAGVLLQCSLSFSALTFHASMIHTFQHPCFSASMLFSIHAFHHPCFSASMLFSINAFQHPCFSPSMLFSINSFHHPCFSASMFFSMHPCFSAC